MPGNTDITGYPMTV